jgi:hypothetical protein
VSASKYFSDSASLDSFSTSGLGLRGHFVFVPPIAPWTYLSSPICGISARRAVCRLKLGTAKGTAALLVPIANYVQQSSGNWDRVFLIASGANILASLLAIAVLKPWRRTVVAQANA